MKLRPAAFFIRASVSALAVLTLLTALLSGCGGSAPSPSGSAADTTASAADTTAAAAETDIYSSLPKADYSGYAFRMLQYKEISTVSSFCDAESLNGELINDDIYNRTRVVEGSLDITIRLTLETLDNVNTIMEASILAGEDDYDVFWQHTSYMTQHFLSKGYLQDMSGVSELNFQNPWWDYSAIENISVGKKIFYAFGDLNLQLFDFQAVVAVNHDLVGNYQLEDPYDLTDAGTWTLDKFISLGSGVAADLNGDSKMGDDDLYGYGGGTTETMFGFWHACNTSLFSKDADNIPSYSGVSDKFAEVFSKLCTYFGDRSRCHLGDYTAMFKNGKLLFISCSVGNLSNLRESDVSYGIVPYPKYDEAQDVYYSFVTNQIQPTSIPMTNTYLSRTGTILENLSAQTYRLVRSDYFQNLLNQKYLRDDRSVTNLTAIYASPARFEWDHIYMWGNIADAVLGPGLSNAKADIVSSMAKYEPGVQAALEETLVYTGARG